MRRPDTIRGSLWILLRIQWRTVAVVVVVSLLLALFALAIAPKDEQRVSQDECQLEQMWSEGAWRFDYVHVLELRPDGTGEWASGHDQAIRDLQRFSWRRVQANEIELFDIVDVNPWTDEEESHPEPRRRYAIAMKAGDYRFKPDHPYDDGEHRYGCRLQLSRSDQPILLYGN